MIIPITTHFLSQDGFIIHFDTNLLRWKTETTQETERLLVDVLNELTEMQAVELTPADGHPEVILFNHIAELLKSSVRIDADQLKEPADRIY